jgi:3-deoxy-D-manno-octulosonic-acid transferase
VLVNGRISPRSFGRYRLIGPFFRRVLADVDRFCVQGEETASRLVSLGVERSKIAITGSLKFDSLDLSASGHVRERVLRYFRLGPSRPVIVAGSTLKGEEAAVLQAFARLRTRLPNLLLIIAPRHPERFGEVEELARQAAFHTMRRSELVVDAEPRAEVVVLDTLGELAQLYQVATVVFVGGSLVDAGGHNIMEPAVFGKPIIFGPYMSNFAEIATSFVAAGAAMQVASERELEPALWRLLADPVSRARLGASARALVEANRGARDKTLAVIEDVLPPDEPPARARVIRPFRLVH